MCHLSGGENVDFFSGGLKHSPSPLSEKKSCSCIFLILHSSEKYYKKKTTIPKNDIGRFLKITYLQKIIKHDLFLNAVAHPTPNLLAEKIKPVKMFIFWCITASVLKIFLSMHYSRSSYSQKNQNFHTPPPPPCLFKKRTKYAQTFGKFEDNIALRCFFLIGTMGGKGSIELKIRDSQKGYLESLLNAHT